MLPMGVQDQRATVVFDVPRDHEYPEWFGPFTLITMSSPGVDL
jgi:hypothetical protein